jgi:hypothetical protein
MLLRVSFQKFLTGRLRFERRRVCRRLGAAWLRLDGAESWKMNSV